MAPMPAMRPHHRFFSLAGTTPAIRIGISWRTINHLKLVANQKADIPRYQLQASRNTAGPAPSRAASDCARSVIVFLPDLPRSVYLLGCHECIAGTGPRQ